MQEQGVFRVDTLFVVACVEDVEMVGICLVQS
jgi:hypothetical protein